MLHKVDLDISETIRDRNAILSLRFKDVVLGQIFNTEGAASKTYFSDFCESVLNFLPGTRGDSVKSVAQVSNLRPLYFSLLNFTFPRRIFLDGSCKGWKISKARADIAHCHVIGRWALWRAIRVVNRAASILCRFDTTVNRSGNVLQKRRSGIEPSTTLFFPARLDFSTGSYSGWRIVTRIVKLQIVTWLFVGWYMRIPRVINSTATKLHRHHATRNPNRSV